MEHRFIISQNDAFLSHLVATSHHSHQLDFSGNLITQDVVEKEFFSKCKNLKTTDEKS